jgi:hypothetical protein
VKRSLQLRWWCMVEPLCEMEGGILISSTDGK